MFASVHISWSTQAGIHSGGGSGAYRVHMSLTRLCHTVPPSGCLLSPHASMGLSLQSEDMKLSGTGSSLGELSMSGV